MNRQKIIKELEGVVRERTPQYIFLNKPSADEKLMKAHYLLAKLYGRKSDKSKAQEHLRNAEHEFFNLCRVKLERPQYITGGLEGFRRFTEAQRKTERELEHYRGKLMNIANELGYDWTSLAFIPTSSNPTKETKKGLLSVI